MNVTELVPGVAVTPLGRVPYPIVPPPVAVTVANPNCVESISVITTTGLTVTAAPAVPAAVGAVTTTGATATATPNTVTAVVAGTLDLP
ncbi:hypothetical protein MOBUDSM44075_03153 [Mycolicibacterium obuense]|uniref:Uncharacterized protein n=1 Tax=Mycolicibacterium obuense TaxID=1807 RepID=A0A0J6VV17_9MYCO|nr:hypothetical protein MOBUDSM44075_03153 [Mycolicibacterium obuense]